MAFVRASGLKRRAQDEPSAISVKKQRVVCDSEDEEDDVVFEAREVIRAPEPQDEEGEEAVKEEENEGRGAEERREEEEGGDEDGSEDDEDNGVSLRESRRVQDESGDVCSGCSERGSLMPGSQRHQGLHAQCADNLRSIESASKDAGRCCSSCDKAPQQQQQNIEDVDDSGLGNSLVDSDRDPTSASNSSGLRVAREGVACIRCQDESAGIVVLHCQLCDRAFHLLCAGEQRPFDDVISGGSFFCSLCTLWYNGIDLSGETHIHAEPSCEAITCGHGHTHNEEPEDQEDVEFGDAIHGDEEIDEDSDIDNDDEAEDGYNTRQRLLPIRMQKYSVSELGMLGIGDNSGRWKLPKGDRVEARLNFERTYRGLIDRCLAWANDPNKPMDRDIRKCWLKWTAEEWWSYVDRSTSIERQIVIGMAGVDFDHGDFLNLPPTTSDELQGWVIYGDATYKKKSALLRPYIGSATHTKHGAWTRLSQYERFFRRITGGIMPPADEQLSAHYTHAMRSDVEITFRVLGTPSKNDGRLAACCLEGLHTMRMGGLNFAHEGDYCTEAIKQAVRDVLPESLRSMTHNGLNHAHQFTQSVHLSDVDWKRVVFVPRTNEEIIRDMEGTEWGKVLVPLLGGDKTCTCCMQSKPVGNDIIEARKRWLGHRIPGVHELLICLACEHSWQHRRKQGNTDAVDAWLKMRRTPTRVSQKAALSLETQRTAMEACISAMERGTSAVELGRDRLCQACRQMRPNNKTSVS